MKRKFDTRDSIQTEEKEKPVEWRQVKIKRETLERLKFFALKERQDMQEIAEEIVNNYLEEQGF